jgi:hypothetical protein
VLALAVDALVVSLSLPALVRIEAHDPVISAPRGGRRLAGAELQGSGAKWS